MIRRRILGRKNVSGIQIKRASACSYCQSKGFKLTRFKLQRLNSFSYPHNTNKMSSPANAAILLLLVLVVDIHYSLASKRPRRCYPEDCVVSDWSSWSSCSSSTSDEQGSKSRSRSIMTYASCGGTCTSKLEESRLCYGSNTKNSQGKCEEFCSLV